MALTDKKAKIGEMFGSVKDFLFRSGHAKRYAGGGERKETAEPKLAVYTSESAQKSDDIARIVSAIAKMDVGGIAVGVSAKDDASEIFVADKMVSETKGSEMAAAWQEWVNEYNDKPGSLILVFNYDNFVQEKANHPDLTVETYLTQALNKLAVETGRSALMQGKGKVNVALGNNVWTGSRTNRAFSSFDDAQKVNDKRVRYSVIVPGDPNMNFAYEDTMAKVPGGERIIKEKGITDNDLKLWSCAHEVGHSIDVPKIGLYESLKASYVRGRMEKKADLNAAKKMWEEGKPEVAWYSMYWRIRNMYDAMFEKAYNDAAMDEKIPEALDEKSKQIIKDQKAKKEAREAKEKAVGKKRRGKPSAIVSSFAALDESSQTLEILSDMGTSVAYNTAPMVFKFMCKMQNDEEFRKRIMSMKAKEFDKWSSQFLKENDLSLSDFGNMIAAAASVKYIKNPETGAYYLDIPKQNKDLNGFLALNQKINSKFRVSESEITDYENALKKDINKAVNKTIHAAGGFFFEDETFKEDNSAQRAAVNAYFDEFYRKVARETAKNGGNETAAFDVLYAAEKNRLVEGRDPNKAVILSNLDRMMMNYQKETKAKISFFNTAAAMADAAETPDISTLSGGDLIATYLDTQMAKFDAAERAVATVSEIVMEDKDIKKAYDNAYASSGELAAQDKLAKTCAAKMRSNVEAISLLGSSRIVSEKATAKAGGEFTGWVADFMMTAAATPLPYKMGELFNRIEEKKKSLADEVVGNTKLMTEIREVNPVLAARMEDIANSGSETKALENGAKNDNSAVYANLAKAKALKQR